MALKKLDTIDPDLILDKTNKEKSLPKQMDPEGFRNKSIDKVKEKVEEMKKIEAVDFFNLWRLIGKQRKGTNPIDISFTGTGEVAYTHGIYQIFQGNVLTIMISNTFINRDGSGTEDNFKLQLSKDGKISIDGDFFHVGSKEYQEVVKGFSNGARLSNKKLYLDPKDAIALIDKITGQFVGLNKSSTQ